MRFFAYGINKTIDFYRFSKTEQKKQKVVIVTFCFFYIITNQIIGSMNFRSMINGVGGIWIQCCR